LAKAWAIGDKVGGFGELTCSKWHRKLPQVFSFPKKTLPSQPLHHKNFRIMGKGDKRTLRGKIILGSYGNARPKKGKKAKQQG
jgi:ribosomal small subunit protein bTHX